MSCFGTLCITASSGRLQTKKFFRLAHPTSRGPEKFAHDSALCGNWDRYLMKGSSRSLGARGQSHLSPLWPSRKLRRPPRFARFQPILRCEDAGGAVEEAMHGVVFGVRTWPESGWMKRDSPCRQCCERGAQTVDTQATLLSKLSENKDVRSIVQECLARPA